MFRIFSLRHLRKHKLRTALAAASVALAVALSISMRVTEASILRSFEKSAEALAGKADVMVTRGTGIEKEALERIEKIGRLRAAPVIQDSTMALDFGEQILVLGIDFARDAKLREYSVRETDQIDPAAMLFAPNAVLVPKSFADRHGLKLRSPLRLDTRRGPANFVVAGILDDAGAGKAMGGRVAIMSISAAAQAFGRKTRYDRIEVAFDGATAEDLRRELGPGYDVRALPKSSPLVNYLLVQQRTVLFAVTVIAMLIGVFIVYNSISLSVVERVKEIGILRALGASRRGVVAAFLWEAGLLGAVASIVGVLLGIALSKFFIRQAADQMNVLVYLVNVREVVVPPDALLIALIVGVGTAVGGALVPSLEASRVPPMVAIRKAAYDRGLSSGFLRSFFAGLVLIAGSVALGFVPGGQELLAGALGLAFVGTALLLPQVMLWTSGLIRVLSRRVLRVGGYLAVDSVVKSPARSALTVLAFAGSLSMIIAVSGTLLSLQRALDRWFDSIFPFHLSVQCNDLTVGAYGTAGFPESAIEDVERDPRVERAYGVRVNLLPYADGTIMLLAIDIEKFTGLQKDPGALPRAAKGGVVVSKNFAYLYGTREGDEIELLTADGARRFAVVGILEDYSWPRGVVLIERSIYRDLWQDDSLSYLDVRLHDAAQMADVKRDLASKMPGQFVYDVREVRGYSVDLVRDWFKLADAQIFLAVLIGAIGVINTLWISVLTRSRQLGLLRALGASEGQILKSLAFEAGFLGLLSGALGCAIGLFIVAVPMSAMLERASGYDLPWVFPGAAVAVSLACGVGIALLSSLIPIRFARRIDLIDAIGYE